MTSFSSKLRRATFLTGALLAVATDAYAQAAPDDQIIVTGTRRTDRSVLDSTAPIDVIGGQELQQQASGDMNKMLTNLIPSFSVGRFVGINSDGSAFVRPPTLRGLPPDQVLVLVNGKRRHRSALVQLNGGNLASGAQAVDLNQIPGMAIERIEVLRDGASAQYGSDAIAGVMNYTLKKAPSGGEVAIKYGEYYEGDGANIQYSGNIGLPLTEKGFVNVSAEYLHSRETSRGGDRAGAVAVRLARPDIADKIKIPAQIIGAPDVKSTRVFINSGYEISPKAELYLFGNYGDSHQETEFNWRQPYSAVGPAQSGVGTQNYAASTVFNTIYLDQLPNGTWDVNGRRFSFLSVFPYGYNPRFIGDVEDNSVAGGLRGTLDSGLTYDFSASRGESKVIYHINETLNLSMGPDSPTKFYAGTLNEVDSALNADFSYPLELGLASPVTFATGAEFRTEQYIISQGEEASWKVGPYAFQRLSNGGTASQPPASNGFPGFAPNYTVDSTRESYSGYLDVEGDITEKLSAGIAVRYEHYSDFGDTTNAKISGRYEFNDMFAIRGAASTGFRAPTAGQLYTAAGITGFVGSSPTENVTLPPTSAAAKYFGAKPLVPEKSVNLAGGFVLRPGGGFTLTADYYHIDVDDRLGRSQSFEIINTANPTAEAATRAILRDLGVQNWSTIGTLSFFTNAFATTTQGVDLVANHRAAFDVGTFSTTLTANWNETDVTSRNPAIINDVRVGNIERSLPKRRATLTEQFTTGNVNIMARASYYGSYISYNTPANGGNKNGPAEVIYDLEVRYDFNEKTALAIGVENLFDTYPPTNARSRGRAYQERRG